MKKPLAILFLTIFLNALGIGILIPITPQLFANPDSPAFLLPPGWSLETGYVMIGLLIATYPLMQFVALPILGRLSDRYGRKKILIVSLLGTVLGYILFAIGLLTKNIPLLFAARALDGLTGGNLSVAQAATADISTRENRAQYFGITGSAFGLGLIFGPYLGAVLGDPGARVLGLFTSPDWVNIATPFWFAAMLGVVNTLLIIWFFSETLTEPVKKLSLKWDQALANISEALRARSLRPIFVTLFLYWAGFTLFTTFFQVYLQERLGFDQLAIGEYFATLGVIVAVTQLVIVARVSKRFEHYNVLRLALPATGFALLLLLLADNYAQLIIASVIFGVWNGLVVPNLNALMSDASPKASLGETLGIGSSVRALAQTIPAALAGYLAFAGVAVPAAIGGICIIAAGVAMVKLYKPTASHP